MNILILGAGLMGRAIAFDLMHHEKNHSIQIADAHTKALQQTQSFLHKATNHTAVECIQLDTRKTAEVKKQFKNVDIAISAVPYHFNSALTKLAIHTHTHFLDLGGNNDIVATQRLFFKQAQKNEVTILPDCGLAPGMISIITRDIVEYFDTTTSVKIRVGGVPLHPTPPLKYQIVFSPNGLINEYIEDALVLDSGEIKKIPSLTQLETVSFPEPFTTMEAFLTSGGCSTLPYTYQNTISHLDYKTIRYPGHCALIKPILDFGFASQKPITLATTTITPREVLIKILEESLPANQPDVVLLKVLATGIKNKKQQHLEYQMIDYYDTQHAITSMMRTTAYPVSILAQMIMNGEISDHGVFCNEEIVPPQPFFKELKKRNIQIKQTITPLL